ncbi:MAG: PIG-L deacetylase family protein [Hyphomicrobium sp.]
MKPLVLGAADGGLNVLALGAHSDDLEIIGMGGTILEWIASGRKLTIHWCILSTPGARRAEAEAAARDFMAGADGATVICADFRDGHFPYDSAIKAWFEQLKAAIAPDIVFTHRRDDAHQDHRTVSQLTWNTFRDHTILEYEIPKWDGDLGQPNVYVPVRESLVERKVELLERHFGTQRGKDWFDRDTFRGLARLRGMECRSEHRFAEAFVCRKLVLG